MKKHISTYALLRELRKRVKELRKVSNGSSPVALMCRDRMGAYEAVITLVNDMAHPRTKSDE